MRRILILIAAAFLFALPATAQTPVPTPQKVETGIALKKPVFGGACKVCPWGALGEIVRDAMKPYGYDVLICYHCSRADAPRIVAGAQMPPPWRTQRPAPGNRTVERCRMIVPTSLNASSSNPIAMNAACPAISSRTSSVSSNPRAGSHRFSASSRSVRCSSRCRSASVNHGHHGSRSASVSSAPAG